jgi:hypothetical protein
MSSEKRNKLAVISYFSLFLQSLSFYVLAYLLIYVFAGISTLYIAYDMDIPVRLLADEIQFNLADDSPLWTFDAIVSVFMTAPVISFIVGVVSLLIYQFFTRISVSFLLAIIWLFLHAFNQTFGLVSEDLITQTGLTRVANTLEIANFMIVITIGVSLFFLFKAGTFGGKLFFFHMPEKLFKQKYKRFKLLLFTFFLPWITGSLVFFLISWPLITPKEIILSLLMLFMLICLAFVRPYKRKDQPTTKQIAWHVVFYPLLMIGFIIAFLYFLRDGIGF